MNRQSRKNRKRRKSHRLKRFFTVLIILALLVGGGVMFARHLIQQQTNALIAKISDGTSKVGSLNLPAMSPEELAQKLTSYSANLANDSHGLIDSAKASTDGSTVTYTLQSSKLNGTMTNALLSASGATDQLQNVADQALNSMSQSGVSQPKVVIQLTNAQGQPIKTLSYSK